MIMSNSERKLAAEMSYDRPVECIEEYTGEKWYEHESMSVKDKLKLALYRRFLRYLKKDKLKKDAGETLNCQSHASHNEEKTAQEILNCRIHTSQSQAKEGSSYTGQSQSKEGLVDDNEFEKEIYTMSHFYDVRTINQWKNYIREVRPSLDQPYLTRKSDRI